MSEFDAHQYLIDTARMRVPDTLEDTQRMAVIDRRYRQHEAQGLKRLGDFRDGQRAHELTVHEKAQQDGFPDE